MNQDEDWLRTHTSLVPRASHVFPLTVAFTTLRPLCVIVNANCRGRQPSNKAAQTHTHTHRWVVLWWANVCMRVSFLMATVTVGVTLDKEIGFRAN